MEEINIDNIITRLLEGRASLSGSIKNVQLTEGEILSLCHQSREIFSSQPTLLELSAPIKICGIVITPK